MGSYIMGYDFRQRLNKGDANDSTRKVGLAYLALPRRDSVAGLWAGTHPSTDVPIGTTSRAKGGRDVNAFANPNGQTSACGSPRYFRGKDHQYHQHG
ncbi:MAG: hypothetical protein HYX90_01885 [Chloroflexi bacterium]|nr:hypothetical protein [Chloroflexota bacterium]